MLNLSLEFERDKMQGEDVQRLAAFVFETRKRKGMSQPDITRRGGPSSGWIGALEAGTLPSSPKRSTLIKLAQGLGVPVPDVLRAAGQLDTAAPISQTTEQEKTPKPWIHHDFSQTSEENKGGEPRSASNELSTLSRNSSETGKQTVNLNGRTGDGSHITLLSDVGEWRRLPVFRVSCGDRVLINDEPTEWASWPLMMVGEADGAMMVEGTSMLGCGYKPGDVLFFELINGHRPVNDDHIIADLGDDGAVCKVYRQDAGGGYLVSAPGEATTFFRRVDESVRLVGIVTGSYTPRKRTT